jgi:hypothetical protein
MRAAPKTKIANKTKLVAFKLTPEQYRLVEQRAEKCGVRVSAWMRSIVLQTAVSRPGKDGNLTVREPNGATT